MYGFVQVGAGIPRVQVADCEYNTAQMIEVAIKANAQGIQLLVFPELSLTGYTCGDLFLHSQLITQSDRCLKMLIDKTEHMDMVIVAGLPIWCDSQLFNCAAVCFRGKVLGVVPKTYIPNYGEFSEKRWFASSDTLLSQWVHICGQEAPFGQGLLFRCTNRSNLTFGVEICEDLWTPIPPSSHLTMHGATIVLNLSASNALAAKDNFRQQLVAQQSSRCICGYVYASAGTGESTTDLVFDGHSMIYEKGDLLSESQRFALENQCISAEIDVDYIMHRRIHYNGFTSARQSSAFRTIAFEFQNDDLAPHKVVTPSPFVPTEPLKRRNYYSDVYQIQTTGLLKRMAHVKAKHLVIGISGGLDSTLALLAAVSACDKQNMQRTSIIGITMPGFGTTDRTYQNALDLMAALGVNSREISIKEACLQHFEDIGHDAAIKDTTYENVQARERMQILMDVANKEGGLVVGTGDLSEMALGFSTYNGDHMSMYGVNGGIPKTLIRGMLDWVIQQKVFDVKASSILADILNTPVSPELLPADKNGTIAQKTEELIGPYELHDFFLYYFIDRGYPAEKLYYMACTTFEERYAKEDIRKWLKLFFTRFFSQQFKRSCMPDGPKVQGVSLSPRGDWRMPSDASCNSFIQNLK